MASVTSLIKKESSRLESYKLILGYLMLFVAFAGGAMLLPLLMMAFYPKETDCYLSFLVPGASCLVFGIVASIFLLRNTKHIRLGKHQDSVLLTAIWVSTIALSTLPFCLADNFNTVQDAVRMSWSEAFFEMSSGYSTTGYTVFKNTLDGVSAYGLTSLYCPHVFLFYRSLTQFLGGAGLVLIVASVIADRYGMKLFYTEGHNDRLLPNLGKTAKLIFLIYTFLIAIGTVVLFLFGLNWFEALCTSISAMATGGFSTRSGSLYSYVASGYAGNGTFGYNAIGVEVTTMLIMLFGSISFLLLFRFLTFRWKRFFKDCEIRFATIFLIVFISLMTCSIVYEYNSCQGTDWATALRYASFQTVSCLTTTGYVNAPSVAILGQVAIYISIFSMLIGGGAGSTAGGLKQYRVVMALKEMVNSIRYRLAPHQMLLTHNINRDGEVVEVDDGLFRDNSNYIILFLLVVVFLALGMTFLPDIGFGEAFYQVVSGITSGGNAILDPITYGSSHPLWAYNTYLWIISASMILGRLEILPFYFGAVRVVKDIIHKETK